MSHPIDAYFEKFNAAHIAVVGDVMTDSYLLGSVSRISPEAPVPVVHLDQKDSRLGGAANVALNIAALGAKATMVSVVGDDKEGKAFIQRAEKQNISCDGVVLSNKRQTTVKTRIIAQNQQLLRVDEEQTTPLLSEEENQLIEKFESLILKQKVDAVIFEDYNKGVLTDRVIKELIDHCNKNNIPTTVDPKKENFLSYKYVTLFKPNLKELREGIDENIVWGQESFKQGISELEGKLENQMTLVTLSEKGVFIKGEKEQYHIPAHIRNISDVSGAGDTVISTATLCLIAGMNLAGIAAVANLAGGIVCEEIGVVPIDKSKLLEEAKKTVATNVS